MFVEPQDGLAGAAQRPPGAGPNDLKLSERLTILLRRLKNERNGASTGERWSPNGQERAACL
jgi:hypothetical protein